MNLIKTTNVESELQTEIEHIAWLEGMLEQLFDQIEQMEKTIEELECSLN